VRPRNRSAGTQFLQSGSLPERDDQKALDSERFVGSCAASPWADRAAGGGYLLIASDRLVHFRTSTEEFVELIERFFRTRSSRPDMGLIWRHCLASRAIRVQRSLCGLRLAIIFLHDDGRAAREAIELHEGRIRRGGSNRLPEEREALIAFLKSCSPGGSPVEKRSSAYFLARSAAGRPRIGAIDLRRNAVRHGSFISAPARWIR